MRKTLPNVVYSETTSTPVQREAGLAFYKEAIKEHGLNRVIVASCTPRTHEPFQVRLPEAGLNKYLFRDDG